MVVGMLLGIAYTYTYCHLDASEDVCLDRRCVYKIYHSMNTDALHKYKKKTQNEKNIVIKCIQPSGYR